MKDKSKILEDVSKFIEKSVLRQTIKYTGHRNMFSEGSY